MKILITDYLIKFQVFNFPINHFITEYIFKKDNSCVDLFPKKGLKYDDMCLDNIILLQHIDLI